MLDVEELLYVDGHLHELSEILIHLVDGGASIGFLAPLEKEIAEKYWKSVQGSSAILLVAKSAGRVVGTVQLQPSGKQSGHHRAEVAKLLVHPDFWRRGIARRLMEALEKRAREEGLRLLVLDTREGDPSNILYRSLGFLEVGRIPDYAEAGDGTFESTVFYYKLLD